MIEAVERARRVYLGVVLPVFRRSPDGAFRAAAEAEEAGIDGVFVYDHLWPLGSPGKAALSAFPLLGALCRRTVKIRLGTLVARVGAVADAELVSELLSVDALSGGRLLAGLGTGDLHNSSEGAAYGIAHTSAAERRASLEAIGAALLDAGVETWVGGGAPATDAIARRLDCTLNLWSPTSAHLERAASEGPVSWAGDLPEALDEATDLLARVVATGVSWIVVHWPGSARPLFDAATLAGIGP